MTTLRQYAAKTCPRCGTADFYPLGDEAYIAPALHEPQSNGKDRTTQSFLCYVKVCRFCAYTELYSKYLVDEGRKLEDCGGFGVVTLDPTTDGYLLSIFKDYDTAGGRAHDFTVPLSAAKWMEVRLIADSDKTEDVLINAVFDPAYLDAWQKRVGKFPVDFGSHLRELIKNTRL